MDSNHRQVAYETTVLPLNYRAKSRHCFYTDALPTELSPHWWGPQDSNLRLSVPSYKKIAESAFGGVYGSRIHLISSLQGRRPLLAVPYPICIKTDFSEFQVRFQLLFPPFLYILYKRFIKFSNFFCWRRQLESNQSTQFCRLLPHRSVMSSNGGGEGSRTPFPTYPLWVLCRSKPLHPQMVHQVGLEPNDPRIKSSELYQLSYWCISFN